MDAAAERVAARGARRRADRRVRRLRPRRRLGRAPSPRAGCARMGADGRRDRAAPVPRGLRAVGGGDRAAARARARPRRHGRLRHLLGAPRSRLLAEHGRRRRRHRPPRAGRPACRVGVPVADPKLDAATARRATSPAPASRSSSSRRSARLLGFPDAWRDARPTSRRSAPSPTSSRCRREPRARRRRRRSGCDRRRGRAIAALAAVGGRHAGRPVGRQRRLRARAAAQRRRPHGRPAARARPAADRRPAAAEELAPRSTSTTGCGRRSRRTSPRPRSRWRSASTAGERALVLAGEGWHEGVKGIVASRLDQSLRRARRSCFTIEDGVARGSGRSVGSVDLLPARSRRARAARRASAATPPPWAARCPPSDLDALPRAAARLPRRAARRAVRGRDARRRRGRARPRSASSSAPSSPLEPFGHGNRTPLLAARGVFMNGRQRVGKLGNHLQVHRLRRRRERSGDRLPLSATSTTCVEHETRGRPRLRSSTVDEWRGRTRVQLQRARRAPAHARTPTRPASSWSRTCSREADEILAREEYAGIEDAAAFHTKLAGVTFEGRQDVLERLVGGHAAAARAPAGQPVRRQRLRAVRPARRPGRLLQPPARRRARARDRRRRRVRRRGHRGHRRRGGPLARRQRARVSPRRDAAPRRTAPSSAPRAARSSPRCPPRSSTPQLDRRFIGDRSLHEAQVDGARAPRGRARARSAVMATGRGKSLIFHLHAARDGAAARARERLRLPAARARRRPGVPPRGGRSPRSGLRSAR